MRGPVASSFDAASVTALTAALRDAARSRRLTHVTADPDLEGDARAPVMLAAGWRPAPADQLPSTQIIDPTIHAFYQRGRRTFVMLARRRGLVAP